MLQNGVFMQHKHVTISRKGLLMNFNFQQSNVTTALHITRSVRPPPTEAKLKVAVVVVVIFAPEQCA